MTAEIAREMAPEGVLRVALNHGNVVLVQRGPDDAHPAGVSVELARALAAELGLEVRFVHFERAGDVSGSAGGDVWDLCFLAVDPLRAESIAFSPPYVAIEGCYLVQKRIAAASPAEVDAQGLKVGIVMGSAYALHLTRAKGGAELVTFETAGEAAAALEAGELDALAGVRQAMVRVAGRLPGVRLIDEPFMAIPQAAGVPAARRRAAEFVAGFVAARKADGSVARWLEASGQGGVRVP
jgi:polar amino acid transport system substrate-binding protein